MDAVDQFLFAGSDHPGRPLCILQLHFLINNQNASQSRLEVGVAPLQVIPHLFRMQYQKSSGTRRVMGSTPFYSSRFADLALTSGVLPSESGP
jgi:hypothetical protein